ncbi:MAG: hypothetical protein M1587_04415, partial [Thaumarchaeota archaeon]|nr:hypothetical protein [Nitrososphaerota archaeon]
EVLRQYARQQKLSLEMQNTCAEIKIRAERRGGEILVGLDKNPGGQAEHKSYVSQQGTGTNPKLSDLGISRNQSSRWQAIASIPLQQFEERMDSLKGNGKELTSTEMLSYAGYLHRERERQKKREEAAARAADAPQDERIRVYHGDFRKFLADIPHDSVQLICTDPPYAGPQNDFLALWEDLGKWASEMLAPGKLLIALCGNYYLFECMQALSKHLKYTWTSALVYGTGFPDTMFKYRLKTYWKPAVWFSKGEYQPDDVRTPWIHDIVTGDGGSKVHHKWEQGVDEFSHFIAG